MKIIFFVTKDGKFHITLISSLKEKQDYNMFSKIFQAVLSKKYKNMCMWNKNIKVCNKSTLSSGKTAQNSLKIFKTTFEKLIFRRPVGLIS